MRKVTVIAMFVALFMSISVNLYLLVFTRGHAPTVAPEDQKWAEKTISYEAARQHAPRETIERLSEVRVMHFPHEVCVALVPARGVAGGSNVTCFATETEKINRWYEVGE